MKNFISKDSETGIYYFYYQGTDRKRKRLSLKTKNYEQAVLFSSKINKEEHQNEKAPAKLISLEDFKEAILNYAKYNHSNGTYELYKTTFANLLHFFGNIPLKDISLSALEEFKVHSLKSIKNPTVNIYIRNIKAAFNLASKWNLITSNPSKDLKKLKEIQNEKNVFLPEQFKRLIDNIDKAAIKQLVYFGYYTGCRLSELLNLQWNDIDQLNNLIFVKNKTDFKTKSGKIRKIPLSNKLIPIIQEMNRLNEEDYLFLTPHGNKFTKDYAGEIVRRGIRKAGLPRYLHFHCLRHTFITELLRKGVNIYYVSKLAGHSNITTTMGYIHTDTEDYRTAINLL